MKNYSIYTIDFKLLKNKYDFSIMEFLRQKKVPTIAGTFQFNFITLFFYEWHSCNLATIRLHDNSVISGFPAARWNFN